MLVELQESGQAYIPKKEKKKSFKQQVIEVALYIYMFLWVIVEVLVDFFRASNDSIRASEFHVSACEAIVHLHVKRLVGYWRNIKKGNFFF